MIGAYYETREELANSIGKPLRYTETQIFGDKYTNNGTFEVVAPDPYKRREWWAHVTMENGLIKAVKFQKNIRAWEKVN